MKGYLVATGFMGWTGTEYRLFSTEEEYVELYRSFNAPDIFTQYNGDGAVYRRKVYEERRNHLCEDHR